MGGGIQKEERENQIEKEMDKKKDNQNRWSNQKEERESKLME